MDGKTARGASSPAKPALHMPDPLSTTSAATSSSHMFVVSISNGKVIDNMPGAKMWDSGEVRPVARSTAKPLDGHGMVRVIDKPFTAVDCAVRNIMESKNAQILLQRYGLICDLVESAVRNFMESSNAQISLQR
ncbi:D-alanine--D-alanine ligase [Frankliniella fusca]|uniref:D-alanine--D-alanine ligase n=1 Tax=Frankliniella fusca TaxID=407009 RepID=A0AAE1H0L3_9NEOP|nr:D-alanine--D-alanine ligase [Frankliniella fusca]